MAHHLKCPFCPSSPSVGYFYKHLIQVHITDLFNEEKDYGKSNLRWLNRTTERTDSPYCLYLPRNEMKYCCPTCNVACNKAYYAEKHLKCSKANLDKQEEYKLLLKLTPSKAPFQDELMPPEPISNDKEIEMYKYREKVYQKMIHNMYCDLKDKYEWTYWFNKLIEDDDIHGKYKELSENNMPEDEDYDFDTDNHKELKLLGIRLSTITTVGKSKLPTPPS